MQDGPVYATGRDVLQYACGHTLKEHSTTADAAPLREKGSTLCPECEKAALSPGRVELHLTVDFHPSGNRTLKFQAKGQPMPTDFSGPLLANGDQAAFYRAVAKKIAELSGRGVVVTYGDTSR